MPSGYIQKETAMWTDHAEKFYTLMQEELSFDLDKLELSKQEQEKIVDALTEKNVRIKELWEEKRTDVREKNPALLTSNGAQFLHFVATEIIETIEQKCRMLKEYAENRWPKAVADTFNALPYCQQYAVRMWFFHSNQYREYESQHENIRMLEAALRNAHFKGRQMCAD